MNTARAKQNFREIFNELLQNRDAKIAPDKAAEIALQAAVKLEELEISDRQISLTEMKELRAMELETLKAKAETMLAQVEALKGVIQGDAILRSVVDNAKINQNNSLVGFINVVGNATNNDAIATYAGEVNRQIKDFDTSAMDAGYKEPLANLKGDVLDLTLKNGTSDLMLYTPKMEIEVGEVVKIDVVSVFGNNAVEFFVDSVRVASEGRSFMFVSQRAGEFEIKATCLNDKRQSVSDKIKIKVVDLALPKEPKY